MAEQDLDKSDNKSLFYCLVVGSRTLTDYDFFCSKMDYLLSNHTNIVIVSGGAKKGADNFAERYADDRRHSKEIFLADWNTYGKAAGYIRNEEMHKYISTKLERGVVAFWDGMSKGTAHSFSLAKKYNNPLKIVRF